MEQEPTKHGWDADGSVYHCSDGIHLSWWKAIVRTPEWRAWVLYNQGENMQYDIPEVEECGWMSEQHARDFLTFVRTQYSPMLATMQRNG